jgi:hypothetical protein
LEPVVNNGILDTGLFESTPLVTFENPSGVESGSIFLGIVVMKVEECSHGVATDAEIFTSETSGKEVQEVWVFQSDIPTVQGRTSKERDGVGNRKGGDPRITHTLENDVEHVLEANELDELGIGWLSKNEQNGLNGMRHCYDSQFE